MLKISRFYNQNSEGSSDGNSANVPTPEMTENKPLNKKEKRQMKKAAEGEAKKTRKPLRELAVVQAELDQAFADRKPLLIGALGKEIEKIEAASKKKAERAEKVEGKRAEKKTSNRFQKVITFAKLPNSKNHKVTIVEIADDGTETIVVEKIVNAFVPATRKKVAVPVVVPPTNS